MHVERYKESRYTAETVEHDEAGKVMPKLLGKCQKEFVTDNLTNGPVDTTAKTA